MEGNRQACDLLGPFSEPCFLDARTACLAIKPDSQTKRDLLALLRQQGLKRGLGCCCQYHRMHTFEMPIMWAAVKHRRLEGGGVVRVVQTAGR